MITFYFTANPPTKTSGFRGFDSSRLIILRGGILMSVECYRGSPGKFDSRTLNRKTLNRWTGHIIYVFYTCILYYVCSSAFHILFHM